MAVTDQLRTIADAVRLKTGTTELIPFDQIDDRIMDIDGQLPSYDGDYEVEPSFDQQVLKTENRTTKQDVIIAPIEVNVVSNTSGGYTLSI